MTGFCFYLKKAKRDLQQVVKMNILAEFFLKTLYFGGVFDLSISF